MVQHILEKDAGEFLDAVKALALTEEDGGVGQLRRCL
mgnify:CR=1 FL=1